MSSFVVSDVNTERLIDEVKLRRSLWDSASEDYKDIDLKKRHWTELCILFFPQFETSTAKEKAELCQSLQAKWKNIKDSYRKYLKSLKTKSGQARKKIKMFVYAEHMSFIDSSIALGPTEASPIIRSPSPEYDSDGAEEVERTVISDEEQSCSSKSTIYRRRKQRLENKIENYLDSFGKQKENSAADDCDDLHFFKSLLPLVKPLPIEKKVQLRMEMMKMAYEYSQNSSAEVTAPRVSITKPPSSDHASKSKTNTATYEPTSEMTYEYSQNSSAEVTAPRVSITKPPSSDHASKSKTNTATKKPAKKQPSRNNSYGYQSTSTQSQVILNEQLLLNHTVTSNTMGNTEVKKYHDLQPMRTSPSFGQNQENVPLSDLLKFVNDNNTEMTEDCYYSEDDFA